MSALDQARAIVAAAAALASAGFTLKRIRPDARFAEH
jgi:hypothetical protein